MKTPQATVDVGEAWVRPPYVTITITQIPNREIGDLESEISLTIRAGNGRSHSRLCLPLAVCLSCLLHPAVNLCPWFFRFVSVRKRFQNTTEVTYYLVSQHHFKNHIVIRCAMVVCC